MPIAQVTARVCQGQPGVGKGCNRSAALQIRDALPDVAEGNMAGVRGGWRWLPRCSKTAANRGNVQCRCGYCGGFRLALFGAQNITACGSQGEPRGRGLIGCAHLPDNGPATGTFHGFTVLLRHRGVAIALEQLWLAAEELVQRRIAGLEQAREITTHSCLVLAFAQFSCKHHIVAGIHGLSCLSLPASSIGAAGQQTKSHPGPRAVRGMRRRADSGDESDLDGALPAVCGNGKGL